jgi:Tfp pilus assembly protein PilP
MRLKNIFFFFVVLLLVACKKHDVSKVDQHTELKEWLKQNGEGYKNGVLQFKGAQWRDKNWVN